LDEVFTGHILQSRLRQAKGDLAGALEELQVLERDFPKSDTFTLTIRRIQVLLAMRDIESASRFVIPLRAILSSDGENGTGRPPIIVVELVEAILSRFYLEQGEIDKALDLLGKLQTTAQPSGRVGILIEMYLLRSLALQKQSQGYACATAIESLERSLVLAEGEGYVLLFAEVGSDVLSLLKGVMKNSAAPDSVKKYARKLFNIVSKEDKLTRIPIEKPRNLGELIEPLTDRELDVLRLLADGLKYNEIAERLFISLNTVRTFIKGIYGKLNVNNRSKAIAQAHQNKLI
jgi:LuxR family transcriptional regulator, maltose regulon positive regulatory protein